MHPAPSKQRGAIGFTGVGFGAAEDDWIQAVTFFHHLCFTGKQSGVKQIN